MKKKLVCAVLGMTLIMSSGMNAFAHWSESGIELTSEEVKEKSVQTAYNVAAEGIVLLKNEKNSLPLVAAEGEWPKVNVFGASSLDPEFAGGGGADVTIDCLGFYEALDRAGIAYNQELYQAYADWYEKYQNETPYAGGVVGDDGSSIWDLSDAGSMRAEWNILQDVYNVDQTLRVPKMEEQILKNAEAYSQNAIVFLNRGGSEGNDLSIDELNLVEAEAAMLSYVTSHYNNVIVIINSCNPMDVSFLDGEGEDQTYTYARYSYGVPTGMRNSMFGTSINYTQVTVDYEEPRTYTIGSCNSALVTWALGSEGMAAVADVLKGEVNPSGRLNDTYAYDLNTNPAYKNFGRNTYDDNEEKYYLAYEEGIYVGYPYYETFCPEGVMYPFGYGLSYTNFDWEITGSAMGKNQYGEDTVEVTVKVTNTGERAGKDVVELYYSQPFYNDSKYEIQKSLVNLGAFKKTDLLQVGESQEITLSLNVRDMASWSDIEECYVLEAGNYVLEIAKDAGEARNLYFDKESDKTLSISIAYGDGADSDLAIAKESLSNPDADASCILYEDVSETMGMEAYSILYTSDEATGTKYKRLFEGVEGYEEVGAIYMEREDIDGVPTVKEGTYPTSPEESDYKTSILNSGKYENYEEPSYWAEELDSLREVVGEENYESLTAMPGSAVVYYDENGNVDNYTIQEMFSDIENGILSEDDAWTKFLDQLSVYEMLHVCCGCEFQFPALEQYGVYWSWGNDGAAQVGMGPISFGKEPNPKRDENYQVTGFPSGTCLSATWNTDLALDMGTMQGYEAYLLGHSALYAPGLNLHRTPSGGRNFEYMSEDTYLGGMIIANLAHGMQEPGGLCAGVKHFMLNNQETERGTVHTYVSEQALRETYAEAWEICFKEGGAMGIMGAYNNIGPEWVGTNYALNTSLLRDEWGYKGYIVSDYFAIDNSNSSWLTTLISAHDSLEDKMDWTSRYAEEVLDYYAKGETNQAVLLNSLRTNTRHIFSAWSISNGYIEDVEAAIAAYEAGGYNFDPVTPEEHGYTDVGWYGMVDTKEAEGSVVPVTISFNHGVTKAIFTVKSPEKIEVKGKSYITGVTETEENGSYIYEISYENSENYMDDGILFELDFGRASKVAEVEISCSEAVDRIGHATKLLMPGEEVAQEEAFLPF